MIAADPPLKGWLARDPVSPASAFLSAASIRALLATYFPAHKIPPVPDWPFADFDTIWTVTLDAQGNLTVTNALCEGIDSAKLPVTAPHF